MKRYIIDTCVFIWILQENKRIDDVYYDMQYYQGDFYISIESISEVVYLIQSGKLKILTSYNVIFDLLNDLNIKILDFDLKALNALKELPFFKEHKDPTDRKIIAHAIANNCILISSDNNFSLYRPYGLTYIDA
jgi:PIN domain nuclease of toxin-antitoxin system